MARMLYGYPILLKGVSHVIKWLIRSENRPDPLLQGQVHMQHTGTELVLLINEKGPGVYEAEAACLD